MNRNRKGFSLIELVVVIVVIGLLALTALPRFINVTEEAKKSSIEGVAGGFATAVLLVRTQWMAEIQPNINENKNQYNIVNYDGVKILLTNAVDEKSVETGFQDGYPWVIYEGHINTLHNISDRTCSNLMEGLLQNPPKVAPATDINGNGVYKYMAKSDSNNATCTYVQLAANTRHKFIYELKTGRVTIELQ